MICSDRDFFNARVSQKWDQEVLASLYGLKSPARKDEIFTADKESLNAKPGGM